MGNLDELLPPEGGDGEAAPTPQAEAPAPEVTAEPVAAEAETAEQKASRERDERGRFKAKDEQPMVPLAALHETRDKVRDLEARLAAIAQPQPQPQQVPDMFEDPEGYQNHLQSQLQSAIYLERRNISHRFAIQQYGEEAVSEAVQWGEQVCNANPQFNAALLASPDPVGTVVAEYQRQKMLSQIGSDPKEIEAYLAWKQAQTAPPPAASAAPAIPNSLATEQSARGGPAYQPPSLEQILKG